MNSASQGLKPGIRPSRSLVSGEARIRSASQEWLGDLRDLSIGGLLLVRPKGFALSAGSAAEIEIRIPGEHPFRLRGEVARLDADLVAFSFEPLSPAMEQDIKRLMHTRGRLRDDIGGH
jgi:hypothetical protein